jgi:cytochrome P450
MSFILMDDPEHARLRRMVTAPFMIKKIEAMRPGVQKRPAVRVPGQADRRKDLAPG